MPYNPSNPDEKLEPEILLTYKNIAVFREYTDNDITQPSHFFYATYLNNSPSKEKSLFDIRDLPQSEPYNIKYCSCCHITALKAAIDAGEMPPKEKKVQAVESVQSNKKVVSTPSTQVKRGRPKGSTNKKKQK